MTDKLCGDAEQLSPKQLIDVVRAVLSAVKNGTGPIAVVVDNNQLGTQHIVETAPHVTLDVGMALYAAAPPTTKPSGEAWKPQVRQGPEHWPYAEREAFKMGYWAAAEDYRAWLPASPQPTSKEPK